MAIHIIISGEKMGKSIIYSERDKRGRMLAVPLYRMIIFNETGTLGECGVTRDTVSLFGRLPGGKYAKNKETPPNKPGKPYRGHIRTDGKKGFRIELYGQGIARNRHSLRGIGKKIRTYIQIHIGPGMSEGCFLLADGIRGRNRFERAVRSLIAEDKKSGIKRPEDFVIQVAPRSRS